MKFPSFKKEWKGEWRSPQYQIILQGQTSQGSPSDCHSALQIALNTAAHLYVEHYLIS